MLPGELDGVPREAQLYSCAGCLAISAVQRIDPAVPPQFETTLVISGSAVARVLDQLREPDTLVSAYEEIVADPALAQALRIPEVFALARSALRGGAAISRMIAFTVQRGSRTTSSASGAVGVEGTWVPDGTQLDVYGVPRENVANVLERTKTDDAEPGMRFFPAFLQTWEGEAVLVEGARVEVIGEEGTRLHVRPRGSRWVEENRLSFLRVPLDFLRPDPDAP